MGLFSLVHALLGQFTLFGTITCLLCWFTPFTKDFNTAKGLLIFWRYLHSFVPPPRLGEKILATSSTLPLWRNTACDQHKLKEWHWRTFTMLAKSSSVEITLLSPVVGCAATLHFGKCSQPSIKPTGTPHPCHVGNLIPTHQSRTS